MFAIRCLVCNRAVNLIGAFRFHSFSFHPRRSRGVGDAQRSWRFVPITISCSEADGNCHGKWGAAFFRAGFAMICPLFSGSTSLNGCRMFLMDPSSSPRLQTWWRALSRAPWSPSECRTVEVQGLFFRRAWEWQNYKPPWFHKLQL